MARWHFLSIATGCSAWFSSFQWVETSASRKGWLKSLTSFDAQHFLKYLFIVVMSRAHATVCVWTSEDNFVESALSFHHVHCRESNSSHQSWRQVPSPAKASRLPSTLFNTNVVWQVLFKASSKKKKLILPFFCLVCCFTDCLIGWSEEIKP